jgi:Ran GTPase-activating protein (RanGAP) involved in mRNA processing and transport
MFDPSLPSKINVLTLDYNNFGNAGLFNLMTYLTSNKTLNYLSLSYCGIDENGIKYFDQFLKNTTTLKKFILQGNPLKNPGLKELIGLLYDNVTIDEINLNNILFGNDTETIKSLVSLMGSADNILTYHVKFNFLTFEGKI